MATAALRSSSVKRLKRIKRVNLVVVEGNRELSKEQGDAWRISASERFRARQLQGRLERTVERYRHSPDRQSVAVAMLAVEEKLVKALWVIERSTRSDKPKGYEGRNGIDYAHDHADTHARYVDSPGGKYDAPPPRPALPESKEITEARKVQRWIEHIEDPTVARVFTVGAMSKCGDAGRRVHWVRVRVRLPEFEHYSTRSLQGIYTGALREIVAELTSAKISACA